MTAQFPTAPATPRHRRTGLRRVLLGLLAAAAVITPLAATPRPARPPKQLPSWWRPNGCTLSPDSMVWPIYYDFKNICNRHDYCYDEMWYGGGEAGREKCDRTFLNEMNNWCTNQYGGVMNTGRKMSCQAVAATYYGAVRKFGKLFFNNLWLN